MAEQITASRAEIERLITRIEALEKKLAEKESKEKEADKKKVAGKKISDSLDKSFKETGRMLRAFVDASVKALDETADAFSSLSEKTDKESMGEIPAAIVSMLRRTIDIQKKALDKFEESCARKKEDEDSF